MHALRGCKMISLDTYRGKRVLLGFLLLVSCVPLVTTKDFLSLNSTSPKMTVGDRLISSPNPYFEMGIFQVVNSSSINTGNTSYYLAIRYKLPIEQAVTWMANRDNPLNNNSNLIFNTNGLELFDPLNNNHLDSVWSTPTDNGDVVSAQLLDTGNLVLKNQNGTTVWNSFKNSPPTDTLLPGQGMNRSQGYSLNSWQRTGNPAIASDTYSFGWDARGVLALSWTCPKVYLDWKGGPYIPAPDVYAAHTIKNVDNVYFHERLGHLYIGSKPPTAILSGGPDLVSNTTLKRITMSIDGGLRILQYTINQTSNQSQVWKAVANWVVSDRPDSRSQCSAIGTCGQFSLCVSPIDSLEPVTCQCPGKGNVTTESWFTAIDGDPAKGCRPPNEQAACLKDGITADPTKPAGMLELRGVDMPWGGDHRILETDDPAACVQACENDCHCAGVVFSKEEKKCWQKTGTLYNLGYPTVALHGTDRTSYLRNQTVTNSPKPRVAKRITKWVKILVPAVGVPGALLVAVVIFCLCREGQRVRAGGPCSRRRRQPAVPDKFPGDSETSVRNG